MLAAAAVRSNALEAFTSEALKMAADPTGAAAPVALELLIALPQELIDRNAVSAPAGGTSGAGGGAGAAMMPDVARSASGNLEVMAEPRPELRVVSNVSEGSAVALIG